MNGPLPGKEWLHFPDRIAAVAERLKGVQIENQPAIDLIKRYSRQNVLIYADPPYLLSTRTTSSYKHEMTDQEHMDLLEALSEHPGPVLLSGYENDLYNDQLRGWRKEYKVAKAEGGAKRKEILWINPVAAEQCDFQQTFTF